MLKSLIAVVLTSINFLMMELVHPAEDTPAIVVTKDIATLADGSIASWEMACVEPVIIAPTGQETVLIVHLLLQTILQELKMMVEIRAPVELLIMPMNSPPVRPMEDSKLPPMPEVVEKALDVDIVPMEHVTPLCVCLENWVAQERFTVEERLTITQIAVCHDMALSVT